MIIINRFLRIIFFTFVLQTGYFIMKTLITLLFVILFSTVAASPREQQVVPYTLADRDRLIKVEAEIGSLRNELNVKFEAIDKQFVYQQKQIDDLRTLFYWGFGIIITFLVFMMGYMIWDRRTALKPALASAEEARYLSRNLTKVMKEYARSHPDLGEILKNCGL